uniref:PABS domain-containing protein n=1 Tax=Syphacia muris TaxID=451379 RepID=A0A0N5AA69_9BILA
VSFSTYFVTQNQSNYNDLAKNTSERSKSVEKTVVLENLCSTVFNVCYMVVDNLDFNRFNLVLYYIYIYFPLFLNNDSSRWNVDHLHLQVQYVATMIALPFGTSALDVKANLNSSVVAMIGLGGGSLSILAFFFHIIGFYYWKYLLYIVVVEIDPTVVQIASRWFNVTNDEYHRVIVDDGKNFLLKSARKRIRYSVIFLDACGDDSILSCPVSSFLDDEVLELVANELITSSGILFTH